MDVNDLSTYRALLSKSDENTDRQMISYGALLALKSNHFKKYWRTLCLIIPTKLLI